jgi:transcriptional regulator with XRE-family HTH domain
MAGIGARLRAIRQQWRLSLREVEQRSRRIAQERGDSSYQVSTSWLARLERYEREFTVNKLLALAEIYKIPIDQLLRADYPRNAETENPDQLSSPNTTELPSEGLPKVPPKRPRASKPLPGPPPYETTLLPTENKPSHTSYLQAVIGKLNLTLDPVIPAGSIVQIDTSKREISPKKDWTHEFQRPIYFLKTNDGYFWGWCELDEDSQWLVLIPHPLSSAPSRRWKYGTEVEILGRVMSVVIRLAE